MSETATHAEFAELIGVSRQRVTAMVAKGLPTVRGGRIPVEDARKWYRSEVGRRRRNRTKGQAEQSERESHRDRLDRLKADLAQVELDQKRDLLVEKAGIEKALFARARAERDAHVAFPARISSALAAELGVDSARLFAALDREMRAHLAQLSETDTETLCPSTP